MDQKFNAGMPVPFFGQDAMTAPAAAQFGVHHGAILLPSPGGTAGWRALPGDPLPAAQAPTDQPSRTGRRRDHADDQWDRRGLGSRAPGTVALASSPLAQSMSGRFLDGCVRRCRG
ncbi:hypothetical protein M2351_003758 [Azospirillum canadense]|nr:hypothetical protein [Azospirillum canadense]